MDKDIRIVLAEQADLEEIHAILVERCKWFEEQQIHQWEINWYPKKYNHKYFLKQMKENFLYVAKDHQKVVGVMLLKKKDDAYWSDDSSSYYLHHFATRLGYPGLGKEMLEFAYEKCLQDGKAFLKLDSLRDNEQLSEYYQKMGFTNVETGKKGAYQYKLWEKKVAK